MIVYSASDLGSCIRSQVAARLGKPPTPPSEDTKRIWQEGHEWEEVVIKRLINDGWDLKPEITKKCRLRAEWDECTQHEVLLPITSEIVVGAHLDAYGKHKNLMYENVIEVKSCSAGQYEQVARRKWDVGGYFDKYKWQVSAQYLATGKSVLVAVVNKETGEFVFLPVDQPFYNKVQVAQRVLTIESWVRREELPECDVNQYPCPFLYLGCTGVEDRVKASAEVERLAVEYKRAKVREDEAGKEVTRLRGELKKACGTIKKLGSDRVKVTWYMQKNPPRLDREKVAGLGLDMNDLMSQSESERVRVEVKEDEDK